MTSMAIRNAEGPGPLPADVAFPSLDGRPLRGWHWTHPDPRGLLLISHGLGEHGGSYRRTAEALMESIEIDVFAFDFRGSGRSEGRRGVIRSYAELSLDLDAANRWASAERPGLPRFLLGHSNGGLVALRTVLDHDLGLDGLILSNPSLKLAMDVPLWKRLMGEVLLRVAPRITLTTGLSNDQLTHDPEVIEEIASDLLRHNRISPPLYFGMLAHGHALRQRGPELRVPTLLILGGADPIIDPATGRRFFETIGSPDKTLRFYPEMRHEPLNEIGRERVIADIVNWLEPRLRARDATGSVGR